MDRSESHDEAARLTSYLNAPVIKRSVMVGGHATSISLEKPFWNALLHIAEKRNISLNELVSEIDNRRTGNLSSACRLFILYHLQ